MTLIFLNPSAHAHNALQKWNRMKLQFPTRYKLVRYNPPYDFQPELEALTEPTLVVCAGGDGTVHSLLQTYMKLSSRCKELITLGAIGLGSSNDFVKPSEDTPPTRLNLNGSVLADVGEVRFINYKDELESRFFVVNASLGITAEANAFFNSQNPWLQFLKTHFLNGAILWSALKTIFKFKFYPIQLNSNGKTQTINLSNLAILKSPHVSGSMTYDIPIKSNDHHFGVCLCFEMTILEILSVLFDLHFGKFIKKNHHSKRKVFYSQHLKIQTSHAVAIETDGEVFYGHNPEFTIHPGLLKLAGLGKGNFK